MNGGGSGGPSSLSPVSTNHRLGPAESMHAQHHRTNMTGEQPSSFSTSVSTQGHLQQAPNHPLPGTNPTSSSSSQSAAIPAELQPQALTSPKRSMGQQAQHHRQPSDPSTLPTILITYQNPISHLTKSVKARIDRNVPLEEVIRQLCNSNQLAVSEPHQKFALRDGSNNELVTSDNIFRKVEGGQTNFKLVKSPQLEAKEMVERISSGDLIKDQQKLKLVLFSLKDYLRESDFLSEFQLRGGDRQLMRLSHIASGNTLAYALSALQILCEHQQAPMTTKEGQPRWEPVFIDRLSSLLVSSSLINVLRPTSLILRKLISFKGLSANSDRSGAHVAQLALNSLFQAIESSSNQLPSESEAAQHHQSSNDLIGLLSRRIGSGTTSDWNLAQISLSLVNSLVRSILNDANHQKKTDEELAIEFERLMWLTQRLELAQMSKSVLRLGESGGSSEMMNSNGGPSSPNTHHPAIEVESEVLNYQKNLDSINRRLIQILVTSEDPIHVERLMEMADGARELDGRFNEEAVSEEELEARKWKTLGFDSENLLDDFAKVGVLGLKLMHRFKTRQPVEFEKFISEQLTKPDNRRCPFAKASNKCVEILAEIFEWNLTDADCDQQMTVYRPFKLNFAKLHELGLMFFKQMWNESGATVNDFERVGILVRSQLKYGLKKHEKAWDVLRNKGYPFKMGWHNLVKEFENVEYVKVRDRQMHELAMEDGLWNKPPVRHLRAKLYQESFEFVKTQRINTLLHGSWFPYHPDPNPHQHQRAQSRPSHSLKRNQQENRPLPPRTMVRWRFYRLAPNRKYLHYLESSHPTSIKNGVEEMPDRKVVSGGSSKGINNRHAPFDESTQEQMNGVTNNRRFSSFSTISTTDSLMMISSSQQAQPKNYNNGSKTSNSNNNNLEEEEVGGAYHGNQSQGGGDNNMNENVRGTICLMNGENIIVRLESTTIEIHSEWLDGLNLIIKKNQQGQARNGGNLIDRNNSSGLGDHFKDEDDSNEDEANVMATKESAELVLGLTSLGCMIQLLDLSGERVEVPSALSIPNVPLSSNFYYSDVH